MFTLATMEPSSSSGLDPGPCPDDSITRCSACVRASRRRRGCRSRGWSPAT